MTSGMASCGMLTTLTASTMPPMSLSGRRFDSASARFQYISHGISDPELRVRQFSEFADSTILTIAHRLRTVIDYDRVSGFLPIASGRVFSSQPLGSRYRSCSWTRVGLRSSTSRLLCSRIPSRSSTRFVKRPESRSLRR